MNPRKLSSVVLAVTGLIALVVSLASSRGQHRVQRQLVAAPASPQIADGGAPVPPYPPPKPYFQTLIADGGAPVPPYPPPKNSSQTNLMADGGAPVPPYPPPKPYFQTLIADGGAPVPPYPPPKPPTQSLVV